MTECRIHSGDSVMEVRIGPSPVFLNASGKVVDGAQGACAALCRDGAAGRHGATWLICSHEVSLDARIDGSPLPGRMARVDGTATFASVEIELVAAEAGTQEITTDQPGDCPFCHNQIAVGDEAIQCRACGLVADSLYCLGAGGERCLGCYHRLGG